MRPVSSIRGSSYYILNKLLAPLFEMVPGAIMEISSLIAREKFEILELEANEQIVSLNVKNLYNRVPTLEAIGVVLRCLYSSDNPPDFERSTLKLLLKPPFTKVYFKNDGKCYCQQTAGQWQFSLQFSWPKFA